MTLKMTGDQAWRAAVREVLAGGDDASPRGDRTLEVLGHKVELDMARPVVTTPKRKLGYRFMCAEAAWILSGSNRADEIVPYSQKIAEFSDDGVTFFGAYGPKIRDQLGYALGALRQDVSTRRAVVNIWRECPPVTKDYPCTLSCQLLVRNRQLHVVVTMRSSDLWLGVPYDVFNFSMLGAYALLELGWRDLELGTLYQVAGSRHLYQRNWDEARACLTEVPGGLEYAPLDWREFGSGQDLVDHLWALARREPAARAWLGELAR